MSNTSAAAVIFDRRSGRVQRLETISVLTTTSELCR